jgi:hypothetical protein
MLVVKITDAQMLSQPPVLAMTKAGLGEIHPKTAAGA